MNNRLRDYTYSCVQLFRNAQSKPEIYDLSQKTFYDYQKILRMVGKELHELGLKISHVKNLKEKHVIELIEYWQAKQLSSGTLKARMTAIRFGFNAHNRGQMLHPDNGAYGITPNSYMPSESKAIWDFDPNTISDLNIRLSVKAQILFGLRREESLKFNVTRADRGDTIMLESGWTKGGRMRKVQITNEEQRAFLDELHACIPIGQSLIPIDRTNKQQIKRYENVLYKAGVRGPHGFRHAYAQKRYFEITNKLTNGYGWHCPFNGGKKQAELTKEERHFDKLARLQVSSELGHARIRITAVYLGID